MGLFNRKIKDAPLLEDLFSGNSDQALARHIVLNDINPLDDSGIWCNSTKYVNPVIIGSDLLSLYIARQMALTCHYPNFNDDKGINRTVITIVDPCSNGRVELEALKNRFESISGNLLSECIWSCTVYGKKTDTWCSTKVKSFLDVEFVFVGLEGIDVNSFVTDNLDADSRAIISVIDNSKLLSEQTISWIETHCYQYYRINENLVSNAESYCGVDVRRAQVVNMIYEAGGHLQDIYMSDIYSVSAYKAALESFCLHTSIKKRQLFWDKINDVSLKLSSLHCADLIETKIRCVKAGKSNIRQLTGTELELFAKSEHTRWNVEKLISGYRSYTAQEKYNDECLFADKLALKAERRRLKTEQHAHVDICSCNELMRVDFESYKYDCFLTLAADDIIRICPA